jgi:hypothetical protein
VAAADDKKKCDRCGDPITKDPYRANGKVLCSQTCYDFEKAPKSKKASEKCVACGSELTKEAEYFKDGKPCCSQACAAAPKEDHKKEATIQKVAYVSHETDNQKPWIVKNLATGVVLASYLTKEEAFQWVGASNER